MKKIAILGTVGVPGSYGGFETLAEHLVRYHKRARHEAELTVWCSAQGKTEHPKKFESAELRYVNLHANGVQSVLYDMIGLWQAVRSGHDRLLLLGASGALALPLFRVVSQARIVTNIDGIEWKRGKWNRLARLVLRASEWAAVRFSHEVIADNQGIADYLEDTYNIQARVIAYGGDHAVQSFAEERVDAPPFPGEYALALCRIEPENNVAMILEAFENAALPLVFVGNWNNSEFGRQLRSQYARSQNILTLDPIYEPGALQRIRRNASAYIHGHSAGGTNPALVEMMHVGHPILAFDCKFNRYTTEDCASYFSSAAELTALVDSILEHKNGSSMQEIANRRYRWDVIGAEYFLLLREA